MDQEAVAAAFQHPVSGDGAGFRELLQARCLLLQLPDETDGKGFVLGKRRKAAGDIQKIRFGRIRSVM